MTAQILDPKTVTSKAEFVRFLHDLRANLIAHPDEWESLTLEGYLEAMAAWVTDSDGYYRNVGQPPPSNVDWGFIAQVLLAAIAYE